MFVSKNLPFYQHFPTDGSQGLVVLQHKQECRTQCADYTARKCQVGTGNVLPQCFFHQFSTQTDTGSCRGRFDCGIIVNSLILADSGFIPTTVYFTDIKISFGTCHHPTKSWYYPLPKHFTIFPLNRPLQNWHCESFSVL